MATTIQELASLCGATVKSGNPDAFIHSASDIQSAQPGQVTQLTNSRYSQYLATTNASACFIAEKFNIDDTPQGIALLVCDDPEIAFIKAVDHLHPTRHYGSGIAPQAVIGQRVSLGSNLHIGSFAVIGDDCSFGDGCQVLAHVYIGHNVKLGKNCRIYPFAVIYDDVEIGDNVVIHSGAVIGADGFGYKFRHGQHIKVPQVGNVVIGNDVEVGANTCIDRGALGSTLIGEGSKLDNLVQVGHNNKVGKGVVMCGHTGVSGSCTIGDYAILAGSAGIADHVAIGAGAVVMARAGVANDVPAGSQVFGSPAKDKKIAYKEQIALSKLPELIKKIKLLEEKIESLEKNTE